MKFYSQKGRDGNMCLCQDKNRICVLFLFVAENRQFQFYELDQLLIGLKCIIKLKENSK